MTENLNEKHEKHIHNITQKIHTTTQDTQNKISDTCVQTIIQNIQNYETTIQHLEPLYTQATQLIENMEIYYLQQQNILWDSTIATKEWKTHKSDIKKHILHIEKTNVAFEFDQADILLSIRQYIRKFSSSQDKLEHTQKANAFYKLFMDIYTDLDNLCVAYGQLLRKAKR